MVTPGWHSSSPAGKTATVGPHSLSAGGRQPAASHTHTHNIINTVDSTAFTRLEVGLQCAVTRLFCDTAGGCLAHSTDIPQGADVVLVESFQTEAGSYLQMLRTQPALHAVLRKV
jgi:hypothetical protein